MFRDVRGWWYVPISYIRGYIRHPMKLWNITLQLERSTIKWVICQLYYLLQVTECTVVWEFDDRFSLLLIKLYQWLADIDPLHDLTHFKALVSFYPSWKYKKEQCFLDVFRSCGALRDSVPFVQFKNREKHPWRSVTLVVKLQVKVCNFTKSNTPPLGVFHVF